MSADPLTQPRTGRRRPRGLRHRIAGIAVAALAAVAAWALWHVAVQTATLRWVDVLALDGAVFESAEGWGATLRGITAPLIAVVSKKFMLAVLVVTCGLAVHRKRVALAVQMVVLVGGANLSSQLLKTRLTRPDAGLGDSIYNSWPSGHTTVAASMSVVLLLAVPRRFRPLAAAVGVVYTSATGIGTMLGGSHRPSDVVGGVLLVLAWTALAMALDGTLEPGTSPRAAGATVGVLLGAALVSAVAASIAIRRTDALGPVAFPERAELVVAFGGGALAVVAAVCLLLAAVSGLLAMADHDTSASAPLPARG